VCAWFGEFRLVFGASTAANAAVLAVFIGGLGLGGALLGRRVDRFDNPLRFYARLETMVAVASALTPAILWATRKVYMGLGGSLAMGATGSTLVRLLLTAAVLGVPTFLMGGTLPAAVRSIETAEDGPRRGVGLLYGTNTLGAVAGCVLANFWLLETFGTRATLWTASLINLVVAQIASRVARSPAPHADFAAPPAPSPEPDAPSRAATPATVPTWFVLAASAAAGFAFFLMELVWYRMLGPLLGGTVFTFGIILAVALLGIGVGGACYSLFGRKLRPTLGAFAVTCALEAVTVAFPYALGDRIAMLALLLRPFGWMQFAGLVGGWSVVTMLVVFPASFVAGAQFPLMIAMLGRGNERVGEQTGLAYAANTAGAIAGSLAGGFGLMPALSAVGSWHLVAWLLAGLAIVASALVLSLARDFPGSSRREPYVLPMFSVVLVAAVATMLRSEGPTSAWRHSPIGVGRISPEIASSRNAWHAWRNSERRAVQWEKDGVESTVALQGRAGLAFVVNGKSDGHARIDAPTQVMSGMLGAILHPGVKRAIVVGLGTGSTAGWLGAIPDIERVDVAELEPAILHVAEMSAPVNRDVLHNGRVRIILGDAREILLTSHDRYDLVVSEPSNPYRAGVASLFTQEYYRAIGDRLADDGLFLQWLQAYAIDTPTTRTMYATLESVFPEVETWELGANDLVLIASRKPVRYDLPRIRDRVQKEPFRAALLHTWRTGGIEGLFSHYIGRASFARALAHAAGPVLNSDDRNIVEFAFARTARDFQGGSVTDIRDVARARGEQRPRLLENRLDWERSTDEWIAFRASERNEIRLNADMTDAQRTRATALIQFLSGQPSEVLAQWRLQTKEPSGSTELAALASALAESGDEAAVAHIDRLRELEPVEADAVVGKLRLRQGRFEDAARALGASFDGYRRDPWPWPMLMNRALDTAKELAQRYPASIPALREALRVPFVCSMLDEARDETLLVLARLEPMNESCVDALRAFEPHFPWALDLLSWRTQCYDYVHHPEAERAKHELEEFMAAQPLAAGDGLVPQTQ
jgi:spermidine synthase